MTIGTRLAWDGGLDLATDTSGGGFDPAVVAPPAPLPQWDMVAFAIDSVTIDGTDFKPVIREARNPFVRYRVVIGGKDVTYFRGVQVPFPTFGLVSPLLYGSGTITFPQIHANFERAGHGELTWLKKWARVLIQRVDDSGNVVATDYRGFIADFQHEGRNLTCTLAGEATGRAATQKRPMPIFPTITDIGDQVMNTIDHKLRLPIGRIPNTGIKTMETGGGWQLDFLAEILAKSTELDGDQWTVMPNAAGTYRMFQKDTATIAATVYLDGAAVVGNLRRDFTQEPNRVWAQGIDHDGMRIRFAIYPGLTGSDEFLFAGPYSPGDSGDAVTQIIWRLYTVGYIDDTPFGLAWTTAADDPVTEAIKDLQEDRGLSQTGVVNAATWTALFSADKTNYSLRQAGIRPAAQLRYTEAFLRDVTGNIVGVNPLYNRTKPLVDEDLDMGAGFTRRQIHRFSKRRLIDDNEANWAGTITVYTGAVIDGTHNPGDPLSSADVRDARSIQPGMNLWLPNWDGGTTIHVSGVNVSAGSVEYTVDTRARDTMPVWERIKRNRQSKMNPARVWDITHRRSGQVDNTGAFYDGGPFGKITRTHCPADTWTVLVTPAGRSGTLQLLDTQTDTAEALYALSLWGKQVSTAWLDRNLGDPFSNQFAKRVEKNTKDWQDNRRLLEVWGQKDQPCGYWPRSLDPNAFNLVTQHGATADSATDTITLSHHGYSNGDVVYFSTGSVPAGLTANNDYYVKSATLNTFKVSATRGGSAMNITSNATGVDVSTHVADTPPVTGQFRDKSGIPYFCEGKPVLWLAIRPDRDCYVQGGRVLELLLDDASG